MPWINDIGSQPFFKNQWAFKICLWIIANQEVYKILVYFEEPFYSSLHAVVMNKAILSLKTTDISSTAFGKFLLFCEIYTF